MSRKIIGVTVGSPLPKPNLKQTDPNKGDYVKGKDVIPTKLSQLENDTGYMTGSTFLTDAEIELLNALLIQDTLICFPEITATHRSRMGYDEETGYNTHIIEVEATITNIDKTLIQKVEIGRSYRFGTITDYEWFDTDITLGDTTHTLSYSEEKPYATNYNGIYVRLTYYSLIGGVQTMTVKAVYAE